MPTSVLQCCAGIGKFYNCTHPLTKIKCNFYFIFKLEKNSNNIFLQDFFEHFLIQNGDIESSLDPNKKQKSFTCCHWNVHSLTICSRNML